MSPSIILSFQSIRNYQLFTMGNQGVGKMYSIVSCKIKCTSNREEREVVLENT